MKDNVTADQRQTKAAADLKPGDCIPAGFLPNGKAAEVLYVTTFPLPSTGELWVMVAYRLTDSFADAEHYPASNQIPVVPRPVPTIAKHYDTSVGLDVDCACGEVFNEATLAEAQAKLGQHIADGNADPTVAEQAATCATCGRNVQTVGGLLVHIASDGTVLYLGHEAVIAEAQR